MPAPVINSALDAANWFFRRAESDKVFLDNDKLQLLLFLAQVHYALGNNLEYLFPSLFVCDDHGFSEPTLAAILPHGLPLMDTPRFADKINAFLELIWKKYALIGNNELLSFIKNSDSYLDNHRHGQKNLVSLAEMAQKFKSALNPRSLSRAGTSVQHKIRISQNGPVMVSAWQPRKLDSSQTKETKNV